MASGRACVSVLVLVLFLSSAVCTCPEGCSCRHKTSAATVFYLRCEDWIYTDVPEGDFQAVTTVLLAFNLIATLRNDVFVTRGLLRLAFLDLSHNGLSSIQEHALRGLTDLEDLKLGQNNLTSLSRNVFVYTKNLTSLDFSDNPHLLLPHEGLNLPNLKFIYLKNCGLTSIPLKFFQLMPKLKKILIHENKLTTFPPGLISSLSQLQVLDLRHNQFTSMQPELFKVFPMTLGIFFSPNPLQCACDMSDDLVTYELRKYTLPLMCASPDVLHVNMYLFQYCNVTSPSPSTPLVVVPTTATTTNTTATSTTLADPEDVTSGGPLFNPWTTAAVVVSVVSVLVALVVVAVKVRQLSRRAIPHRRLSTIIDEETYIT